jgi:chromosome segregation ATPase
MPNFKTTLIFIVLLIVAFGIGYGLGYMKLKSAEKEWAASQAEMQSKISNLQKELATVKARLTLWEVPLGLAKIGEQLAQKNFGLATQSLDQLQEGFSSAQSSLAEELRKKFDFFLPALEEIRKDVQSMSPQAKKKLDDLKNQFEQAMKAGPNG